MNKFFSATMEKQAVSILTMAVVLASFLGTVILGGVPGLHDYSLHLQTIYDRASERGVSVLSLLRDDSSLFEVSGEYAGLKEHQLRLELPSNVDAASITSSCDYMNRTISITVPGIGEKYFYDYPMVGKVDHIVDLLYEVRDNNGTILIEMDGIYEISLIAEGRYVYLDFPNPRDIYDYLVVIDAGHGGKDVGAVVKDIEEKDINLQIVEKMRRMFDEDERNVGVYYTRTDDSNPSLEARVALANDIGADVFLSVHNNSTASGRFSGIHGTEVMYLVSDETESSKRFAQRVLDHLLKNLGSGSKGLVPGDEIYIIRTAHMPVALAEIGFMTNEEELAALTTDAYQEKAARAMVDAVYETLEVMK